MPKNILKESPKKHQEASLNPPGNTGEFLEKTPGEFPDENSGAIPIYNYNTAEHPEGTTGLIPGGTYVEILEKSDTELLKEPSKISMRYPKRIPCEIVTSATR